MGGFNMVHIMIHAFDLNLKLQWAWYVHLLKIHILHVGGFHVHFHGHV